MAKFRSKVVEIEAFQFKGDVGNLPKWFIDGHKFWSRISVEDIMLLTKNGWISVNKNDYIIKADGEFYPCPPDVFHKKYEAV